MANQEQLAIIAKFPQVNLTCISLEITPGMNVDEWIELGSKLGKLTRFSMFAIGDWLLYGARDAFPLEKKKKKLPKDWYLQFADVTGLSPDTLRKAMWVSEKVLANVRRRTLTFMHHEVVAAFPIDKQKEWLDRAEKGGDGGGIPWTAQELRRKIKAAGKPNDKPETQEKPLDFHFLGKKFKVLKDQLNLLQDLKSLEAARHDVANELSLVEWLLHQIDSRIEAIKAGEKPKKKAEEKEKKAAELEVVDENPEKIPN